MSVRNYLPEPVKCDVCGGEVDYREHVQKFGHSGNPRMFGMWKCKNKKCGALVSCHPGSTNPVGYMALAELRKMRTECHRVFDLLWCVSDSPLTRQSAYYWMAELLKIPKTDSNISKLSLDQIMIVMDEAKAFYREHLKQKEIMRKGKRKNLGDSRDRKKALNPENRKSKVKVTAANYEQFI